MKSRIVITGVGLTAPNGNNLLEFRNALLEGKSGITRTEIRHMGMLPAGLCTFDEGKYQPKKMRKRGTRAGAIGIYCANEALVDSGLDFENFDKDKVGVYIGITEHGNVETENEIHELYQNDLNVEFWSHHHNPRTVANNPAGEVTLNLRITGPHYTIGAACAAGNLGVIQAAQMLQLGEVDFAFAGGVSESTGTFGIFAAFKAQGALGDHEDITMASRPLDSERNGIVISEGGCIYTLERLEDALARGAKIYGEVVGYHSNSDATDFVLPNTTRQIECMQKAMSKAGLTPENIDIVNMHATGTAMGDIQECEAVASVFNNETTKVNCTKGFIGHTMGAAGALELAGNLPSFTDGMIHPCKKIENVDPKCAIPGLVNGVPVKQDVKYILNNSFGMLGINSSLIIKKY
ncbi:beta-ketoacyl synthase, N-terminal domain protein [Bacteriovorax sp. BSW11_IV]|uniref:beta-ketoacyl-[acyl-carrier-protein] synthase family protein n=1 Tax=Bacteriovorax sp. BSW11_IV TaxID=1353529 RepID=UPI00038A1368|nr:beta-ketoacyl-[acyl-carrier-protein] synthase family protein [Bacteriovorax sp. BSW11_IV]EQC50240.1 beta-ketoacyl synthase, N-terminal domain protein [Bacteriovorax sp. BSW11_IV]